MIQDGARLMMERGIKIKANAGGFPGGAVVKNLPANAGNTCSREDPTCREATKPVHHNY